MQGKKKIILGVLFAAVWAGLPAWTAQSWGEVYVSDSLYDWDANADRASVSSSPLSPQTYRKPDDYTGPGAKVQEEETADESASALPSVTQVTLKEQYHEAYKVYEESMEDRFFFYTNVANGGITDQSVILDIPQNMFVTMEKDGALIDYTPGKAVSGYGTYVARLTAIENPDLPFSEQKEYWAIFRFRIQEKPPTEPEEGQGGGGLGYQVDWESYASQQSEDSSESGTSGMGSLGSETGLFDSPGSQNGDGGQADGQSGDGMETGQNGQGTDESADSDENGDGQEPDGSGQAEDGQEGAGAGQNAEEQPGGFSSNGQSLYGLRTQIYNSAVRKYEVAFENGRSLSANIPEGFTGPGAVEFSVSDGEPVQLYRNDSPVEYIPGNSITEPGYYRLDVDGQMWSFVIASSIREMDQYLAPAGMEITQAAFNGEPMELTSSRYLPMAADGQYQIALAGTEGEAVEVTLARDTLPPEMNITIKGGRADIEYLSDDIARITLEKDGQVQEGFAGYVVNNPGSYKLSVMDGAGNVSSRLFTLKYQVNFYGIAAVVLVILLIIGGIVFVFHVKRTVKVR